MKHCDKCKVYKTQFNYCPMCGCYIGENDLNITQEPETTHVGASLHDIEETHPAYAQLQFSRRNTSGYSLYGSSIGHQHTITLRISKSVKQYTNYSEHYHADVRPYIEVEMSQAQFSEAITTMNIGDGVPVTLRQLQGKYIPRCQELTIQERVQRDLNGQLKTLARKLGADSVAVKELLTKKGTLTAQEKKDLLSMYNKYLQDIGENLPFLNECMQEVLDKNVTAAKSDVEAFMMHSLTCLGMEAMQNNNQQLLIDDDYK